MVDAVLHPCKTNAAMADSHPRALTLSPKELLVLDLLRGDDLYGLQLVAASAGRLKRGTVYVTLGRMEEKGYITSTLEAAPSGAGGLPRRIYATTPLGRRMFAAWTSGAKQLVPELGR
jgi:DNA-binding PadR family transcriptional regulator